MDVEHTVLNKDTFIGEPSAGYLKRPRSSILAMFEPIQPELFELEETKKITKTTNGYGEAIIKIDGEIPLNLEVNNGDRFLFISYDQSVLTHGLHKYPAKFFPELPRWLTHPLGIDWLSIENRELKCSGTI